MCARCWLVLASVQRCCCIIGNYKSKLILIKSRGELRTSSFMKVITTPVLCFCDGCGSFRVCFRPRRVCDESNAHLESAKHTAQVCLWVWRSCKGCVSFLCAAKHLKCFYDHQRRLPDGGCDADSYYGDICFPWTRISVDSFWFHWDSFYIHMNNFLCSFNFSFYQESCI